MVTKTFKMPENRTLALILPGFNGKKTKIGPEVKWHKHLEHINAAFEKKNNKLRPK